MLDLSGASTSFSRRLRPKKKQRTSRNKRNARSTNVNKCPVYNFFFEIPASLFTRLIPASRDNATTTTNDEQTRKRKNYGRDWIHTYDLHTIDDKSITTVVRILTKSDRQTIAVYKLQREHTSRMTTVYIQIPINGSKTTPIFGYFLKNFHQLHRPHRGR